MEHRTMIVIRPKYPIDSCSSRYIMYLVPASEY